MENTRNPGMVAIAIGVALAVLFGLLGITGVLSGRVGFGLAAACLVTSALMYIFYSRGVAVDRAGYGALLMIIAVGLILPVLTVNQQQAQADLATQQYSTELLDGATIFGQYCATCHGYQGQGINGPQLNDNPAIAKMTDQDLTRIISAGIPGDPANPTTLAMPAWLDTYGGSLQADDISYLVLFIRSSDPTYRAKAATHTNGFDLVYDTLINGTQQADFKQQKQAGNKPTDFVDDTGKSAVTVQIVDVTSGPSNWGFSPPDIIISAGTKVTWQNVSNQIHTVVSKPGTNPPEPFASTNEPGGGLLAAGNGNVANAGTFSFTFTKPGDYPYYCSLHPAMLGWVEVK